QPDDLADGGRDGLDPAHPHRPDAGRDHRLTRPADSGEEGSGGDGHDRSGVHQAGRPARARAVRRRHSRPETFVESYAREPRMKNEMSQISAAMAAMMNSHFTTKPRPTNSAMTRARMMSKTIGTNLSGSN